MSNGNGLLTSTFTYCLPRYGCTFGLRCLCGLMFGCRSRRARLLVRYMPSTNAGGGSLTPSPPFHGGGWRLFAHRLRGGVCVMLPVHVEGAFACVCRGGTAKSGRVPRRGLWCRASRAPANVTAARGVLGRCDFYSFGTVGWMKVHSSPLASNPQYSMPESFTKLAQVIVLVAPCLELQSCR